MFYYVASRNFDEFVKHYTRVQYFYRELAQKIGNKSQEQDHIEAIYILYLLTFNK